MEEFQLFIRAIPSDAESELKQKFKLEFIEMEDDDSWRPIHHACRQGRSDLVELLISNNCKIEPCTKRGYRPIHLACKNGQVDIVNKLISSNCNLEACDNKWGYRPIHLACLYGHVDIVNKLISSNCNIEACDRKYGYRPIHWACEDGHVDIVNKLISSNCNIEACDRKWEFQPIHLACANGHVDIVNKLISSNCNIEACDRKWGYRPIHWACEKGHVDVIKILISNKCDTNACTKKRKSPIDIARKEIRQEIIDAIKIESIALAMDLKCAVDCDHDFCRKTLDSKEFKKNSKPFGNGANGKVYKYQISQTNRKIVIKRTKFVAEEKKCIEENINKYKQIIQHRNIVQYFGALEKSGKLCIYMEYMPGGSLESQIKKFGSISHCNTIEYSKQILEGLSFLHQNGIIHRDIKPDNILLDDKGVLKLSDFGLSKSLKITSTSETIEKATSYCGTPNYMAPEIMNDEPYDFSADVWSTGATVIHMITGKMPYHEMNPVAVVFRIGITKNIEFSRESISDDMQSFINAMLTPEQSNRPSAQFLLNNSIFKCLA